MEDSANWDSIIMRSIDVGARKVGRKLWWRGYYYANEDEHRLAMLLTKLDIPFTPDVKFSMALPNGKSRIYIADFVFDTVPYLWREGKRARLIHGIEAKAKSKKGFPPKALENERILREQRGIDIMLLSNDDIRRYAKMRQLPMKPF